MTYQEARRKVIEIQKTIAEINNRLCGEFDTLRTPYGREHIDREREEAVKEWELAKAEMKRLEH
ncbi:hypothetical protein XBP1_800004 [Xenorhabdus bovienii str. puntauvense]|uniref:Uncharacterized protein n=1 Tax=Xenorhabdus bovienii str. puntauvense TaxID=1398201 RepID=A0A077NNK1_XENBV|nr:hypothetical protein [Xenorhabdus bovienii]CDG99220.1 hypothetical protein XBP1_800004 [Xenorhabdus bovienii str. puntauvense]